jgi:hypothetical protein
MLLGSLADDEYWSEYGVLAVIDSPGSAYDSADYAGEDDLDPGLASTLTCSRCPGCSCGRAGRSRTRALAGCGGGSA